MPVVDPRTVKLNKIRKSEKNSEMGGWVKPQLSEWVDISGQSNPFFLTSQDL